MSSKSSEPPLKKIKNVVIRNLLCAPQESEWPRLSENDTDLLKAELKRNLINVKVPRVTIPWRELSQLNKENRKLMVKEFESNLPPHVVKATDLARQLRSWLFIGMNAVSRALEADALCCCLLAEDVTPTSLVKFIVQLAKHAKIPVFLISGFKKFSKEVMGFSCIALGFAKPCLANGETNEFGEVCSLVEKYYSEWEKKNRNGDMEEVSSDSPPAGKQHTTTQTTATVMTADAQESCDLFCPSFSFHLRRSSKYERAYTPDGTVETEDTEIPTVADTKKDKPVGKNRLKYKLPTILRVTNNPFKMKRKKKKKKVS